VDLPPASRKLPECAKQSFGIGRTKFDLLTSDEPEKEYLVMLKWRRTFFVCGALQIALGIGEVVVWWMLLLVSVCSGSKHSPNQVEVVVGGLMAAEGGKWDPENSPLKRPFGVDFNTDGDMWIVELEEGRVHKLDADGKLHHAGGDGSRSYQGDGGALSEAKFNGMHNCAVAPNGDLYIADSWNHCIRKVDAQSGKISTIAGTGKKGYRGDGGVATEATFDFVMCVTLNPANEVLHIADINNRRIRAFNLKSRVVTTIAGNGQRGVPKDNAIAIESPLIDPRAVAQDSQGNIWILERSGNALRVVRPNGRIYTVAGTGKRGFTDGPGLTAEFGDPKHLCVDDSDNVYIADDANATIRRFDPRTSKVTTVLGRGYGDPRIRLRNPHGVCYERGALYVVDMGNNRILRLKL
jgi:sugar lactone lactonase YvrE